jgi:hypothetical protein
MKGGVVEEKGWLRDVLRESAERVERLPGWIVGARGEWANKPLRDVLANYRRQAVAGAPVGDVAAVEGSAGAAALRPPRRK